jgi:hypothetical protein
MKCEAFFNNFQSCDARARHDLGIVLRGNAARTRLNGLSRGDGTGSGEIGTSPLMVEEPKAC